MMTLPITGAIIAGGNRLGMSGAERALMQVDGERMVDRQIREMRELCREIIVVTDTPKPFLKVLDSSVRLITDYVTDCGPLGGMHAALHLARHPQVWIVGCDMPFISAEAAKRLAEERSVSSRSVVPIIGDRPMPLHSVYDKQDAEAAAKLLSMGEKRMDQFLGQIRWQGIDADAWTKEEDIGNFYWMIRTKDEYGTVRARIRHEMSTNS